MLSVSDLVELGIFKYSVVRELITDSLTDDNFDNFMTTLTLVRHRDQKTMQVQQIVEDSKSIAGGNQKDDCSLYIPPRWLALVNSFTGKNQKNPWKKLATGMTKHAFDKRTTFVLKAAASCLNEILGGTAL